MLKKLKAAMEQHKVLQSERGHRHDLYMLKGSVRDVCAFVVVLVVRRFIHSSLRDSVSE